MSLLIRDARVLTLAGPAGARRGAALRDLGVRTGTDVLVEGDNIAAVGPGLAAPPGSEVIEAGGRVLMPGFVDAHTHACWAGDRLDEWEAGLRGATYLDLLRQGGGILATVRAVRAAPEDTLARSTGERLGLMLEAGTTTAEVKSGYGLSTAAELKQLRAIRAAAAGWPGTVVATALLGHAIDGDHDAFVTATVDETLPAVSAAFPGITVDAYCERGAWSPDDCERLFRAAHARGHPARVHADQFNSLGMISRAIALGARSVDHLEATAREDLTRLARSNLFGVLLPATGFHTDGRFADGRAFVDAGGAVVVASNYNPGSAPVFSMPVAIALAVRRNRLTPAEAIAAATVNAAALLGFHDRGRVMPGMRADLILLRHGDERMLAFEVGGKPVERVISGGRLVPR